MNYEYTGIFIAFFIVLLLGAFAGWKCCIAWHSRRPAPPTPLQRAICDTQGREKRNVISHMLQSSHATGFVAGQQSVAR